MTSAAGSDGPGKRSGDAFTFIELIIIVLIVGVLIGVSLPRLKKNFDEYELQSFTGNLQSFINYFRDRAIIDQNVIYVVVDKSNAKRYLAETRIQTESNVLKTELKSYRIPDSIDVKITNAQGDVNYNQIAIYPDGNIDRVKISIKSSNKDCLNLTTVGVFGGAKLDTK